MLLVNRFQALPRDVRVNRNHSNIGVAWQELLVTLEFSHLHTMVDFGCCALDLIPPCANDASHHEFMVLSAQAPTLPVTGSTMPVM